MPEGEEKELGGPVMGMWPFPVLGRLKKLELEKIGEEGVIGRAIERAPGVIVKHMGRATGQAAADIAGTAAREAMAEGLGGFFRGRERPILGRLGETKTKEKME